MFYGGNSLENSITESRKMTKKIHAMFIGETDLTLNPLLSPLGTRRPFEGREGGLNRDGGLI